MLCVVHSRCVGFLFFTPCWQASSKGLLGKLCTWRPGSWSNRHSRNYMPLDRRMATRQVPDAERICATDERASRKVTGTKLRLTVLAPWNSTPPRWTWQQRTVKGVLARRPRSVSARRSRRRRCWRRPSAPLPPRCRRCPRCRIAGGRVTWSHGGRAFRRAVPCVF